MCTFWEVSGVLCGEKKFFDLTTIALTTHGYDTTTVMPRCRPHLNFSRANASLTLIPISQGPCLSSTTHSGNYVATTPSTDSENTTTDTHTPQIPLAAITPLSVANIREFLASSIASQHLPQTGSFYAPFAQTPLPPPEPPAATTDMPAPITRRRRRADDLGDAEILLPRKRPPPGGIQESELSLKDIPPPAAHGAKFQHDLKDPDSSN